MDEARYPSGGDGACSKGGGCGEESATCSLVVVEGLLRGDVGGADTRVEAGGLT